MFYENELRFFCDILKKCRVPVCFMGKNDSPDKLLGQQVYDVFGTSVDIEAHFKDMLSTIEPFKVYKLDNSFKLNYIYFLLPDAVDETIMSIGPYLSSSIGHRQILEIGEKLAIAPNKSIILEDYYLSIPVINETSHLFVMLDAFCEQIWGGSSAFEVVEVNRELQADETPINKSVGSSEAEDIFVKMSIMEKRYDFENEFIRAISRGQLQKFNMILAGFDSAVIERRLSDPLRNIKNYAIILNTLSRKAAESGGVHPIYIDSLSSSFASKIEQTGTVAEMQELMQDMFRSYCRRVRKHSMRNYSSTVQKAIIYIESDLSANLTLSVLADAQNVSAGYLSTVFKKETGMTVTEFINSKRVKHAIYLLTTTKLQIQTVALHCGIMDVQYFSKVFKKYTGKTPREYRASVKGEKV